MAKLFWLFLFAIYLSSPKALEFKVLDPCSGKILVKLNVRDRFENVGHLSAEILTANVADFIGSELGVNTMFGTPVGEGALEIISRLEMRSYGWCYSVDGEIPELYPSQYLIDSSTKSVEWFFGFEFYDSGLWKSQCERLHQDPKPFICD
jgi:hypothetical protein